MFGIPAAARDKRQSWSPRARGVGRGAAARARKFPWEWRCVGVEGACKVSSRTTAARREGGMGGGGRGMGGGLGEGESSRSDMAA